MHIGFWVAALCLLLDIMNDHAILVHSIHSIIGGGCAHAGPDSAIGPPFLMC